MCIEYVVVIKGRKEGITIIMGEEEEVANKEEAILIIIDSDVWMQEDTWDTAREGRVLVRGRRHAR